MYSMRAPLKSLLVSTALVALALAATGCGPDCEGICNDLADICDRGIVCTALPEDDREELEAACSELNSIPGLCVQGCDASDDAIKELLESAVGFLNEALVSVGC
jgi:hypothetical protein